MTNAIVRTNSFKLGKWMNVFMDNAFLDTFPFSLFVVFSLFPSLSIRGYEHLPPSSNDISFSSLAFLSLYALQLLNLHLMLAFAFLHLVIKHVYFSY